MAQNTLALLSQRIRTLRRKHRLTQEALARRANISDASVAHIEARKRTPSLEVLVALADALKVSTWELLTDHRLPSDPYTRTDRLLARALRSLTPPDLDLLLDIARRLAAR